LSTAVLQGDLAADSRELCEAVRDLLEAYVETIDDGRLEEWPAFFAQDCCYRVIPRENHDRGLPMAVFSCDGPGMLRDRVVALRKANVYPPHFTRHLLSSIRVKSVEDGVVAAQSNYAVLETRLGGDATLFSAGRYLDRIVVEDGALKFREKTVVCDNFRVTTLLVTPI
jgi:anthranilate 1,2-dioxygenase small subunit